MPETVAAALRCWAVTTFALLVLAGTYAFTLDGRPVALPLTELRDGRAVVEVGGLHLLLDEPRRWDFVVDRDSQAPLTFVREGQVVLGVVLSARSDTQRRPTARPRLPPLTAAQRRHLRGLRVDRSAVPPTLTGLPGGQLCLRVSDDFGLGPSADVKLPKGLACYVQDAAPLPDLSDARFLALRSGGPLDLRRLEGAPRLEALEVQSARVEHLEALWTLPALEQLAFSWTPVPRLRGHFGRLRRLLLRETKTVSLGDLRAPHLSELVVQSDELATLPPQLPALEAAALMTSALDPGARSAFVRAHPRATIHTGWAGLLRHATRRADALRVRGGGLKFPPDSDLLFESKTRAAVDEWLGAIHIDERHTGLHCMCSGDLTVEALAGETVVAAVTVHHGLSLRWEWNGDAQLADDGVAALLQRWNVGGPTADWETHRSAREAAVRRRARYLRMLPPDVAARLPPDWRATDRFAGALPPDATPTAPQARHCLLLLGAPLEPWSDAWPLDGLCLRRVGMTPLAVLAELAADEAPEVDAGLARFLFSNRSSPGLDTPALAPHLPRLARLGVSRPSQADRRATLERLGQIDTPATTAALLAIIEDDDPPGAEADPGFDAELSESARAARLLAPRADEAAAAAIRRRCGASSGGDCAVALRQLVR